MIAGAKKTFKISKIDRGVFSAAEEEALKKKTFSNKDSYSAAKKAANAVLKAAPAKKKVVKFIVENQKPNKKGVKKQLAYTAQRIDEKKTINIAGKELKFTSTPRVKACLRTDVK